MDLKEFTKETLRQIVEGVAEAQQAFSQQSGLINPTLHLADMSPSTRPSGYLGDGTKLDVVEFDVALAASDQTTGEAGGRVTVVGIFGLGAGGTTSSESSSVSRIRFRVPIRLPAGGDTF